MGSRSKIHIHARINLCNLYESAFIPQLFPDQISLAMKREKQLVTENLFLLKYECGRWIPKLSLIKYNSAYPIILPYSLSSYIISFNFTYHEILCMENTYTHANFHNPKILFKDFVHKNTIKIIPRSYFVKTRKRKIG